LTEEGDTWFERWPELLEWELDRFATRGIEVEVDLEARAAGRLLVCCQARFRGEPVAIEVRYPSEYPELPPLVFGPPGLMDRHQHLFGGNFCLLERPLDDWPAGSWGAADLIAERLAALFRDTEAGPDAVRAGEAPTPEPVSRYFEAANDASVMLAEEVRPGNGDQGMLRVRRCAPHMFVVTECDGRPLSDHLAGLFSAGEEIPVPWLRLSSPPPGPSGAEVARWLTDERPGLLAAELPARLANSKRVKQPPRLELCALVFPEEGPETGELHDGYLFLLVERRPEQKVVALLRAQSLSRTERGRRAPELAGLESRRVLVVGAGTLGGDIAVELAKAGLGHLEIVDYDMLELGNLMRHRLGLDYAGTAKARALALAARRANPFCTATATEVQLGAVEWSGQSSLQTLEGGVRAADLVIDASGSHQLAKLLARLAEESGKPLLSAWMSEGFWGAEIARIRPDQTMCWNCFVALQRRGELASAEAGPPEQVVAEGCSQPTTAGAGFDAAEASAVATRLAVQTLQPAGGYPDSTWDHAVLNFRREADDLEVPRVITESLAGGGDCESCRVAVGSVSGR